MRQKWSTDLTVGFDTPVAIGVTSYCSEAEGMGSIPTWVIDRHMIFIVQKAQADKILDFMTKMIFPSYYHSKTTSFYQFSFFKTHFAQTGFKRLCKPIDN